MGKGSSLFTAGWEWDVKAGSQLVDGEGWAVLALRTYEYGV